MLVLTRRPGESIVIGDNITLTVVEVQGDRVKIGIAAPKDVTVLRGELLEELRRTNAEAAGVEVSLGDLGDALGGR